MTWLALAGIATLLGAWYRPVSVDEAWSLVVARRMNRGDRLYRDVFYGAAPLAIWIQALAFRALRPQASVTRTLTVAYALAELWAAVILVGSRSIAEFAVVGILVGLGGLHLGLHNHYGHLTTVASLWAAVAVAQGSPALGGLIAGLGILGRYPQGLVAVAAFAVVVTLDSGWQAGLLLVAMSLAPAALVLAANPSGFRWFLERAVANKTRYLATASLTPLEWVARQRWSTWKSLALNVPALAAMILVVFAPILTIWATVTDKVDDAALAVALALAGAVVALPRFDGTHAIASAALTGTALVMAADAASWLAMAGALAWTIAVTGIVARVALTRKGRFRRDLPSMRWLAVPPLRDGPWPDETTDLPARLFILRIDASLIYACGRVTNPTPFDYPAASTFGRSGQSQVLRAFEAGLPLCEAWHDPSDRLTPSELLEGLPRKGGYQTRLGRLFSWSPSDPQSR